MRGQAPALKILSISNTRGAEDHRRLLCGVIGYGVGRIEFGYRSIEVLLRLPIAFFNERAKARAKRFLKPSPAVDWCSMCLE